MTDNIEMKRVWQDTDFFEILITCTSKTISASTEVYLTDATIDDLYNQIKAFLQFERSEVLWASGERGNQSTPSVAFRIFMKDSSGHVRIETFMELNDGGNLDKHNCCFYVNTEFGMLYNFNIKLPHIKEKVIGKTISLIEYEL